MRIGTKSILFGVHQFLIHPWFVAIAWWKLFGIPLDPRLWVAFFVHDLGYFGKPNMDGPEGETHVELGARIMHWLFDWGAITTIPPLLKVTTTPIIDTPPWEGKTKFLVSVGFSSEEQAFKFSESLHDHRESVRRFFKWRDFCLYHSRFYAKRDEAHFSKLCLADKLSFAMTPRWLYLPLARLTGEIDEYMALAKKRCDLGEPKYASMNVSTDSQIQWYEDVKEYMTRWVNEHKDMKPDTWTPSSRKTQTETGVWQ